MDTLVTEAVNLGVQIGANASGGDIINGVPNSLLSAAIMLIYGFIHRAIEKRHLRKKNLLLDKPVF